MLDTLPLKEIPSTMEPVQGFQCFRDRILEPILGKVPCTYLKISDPVPRASKIPSLRNLPATTAAILNAGNPEALSGK